MIDISTLKEIPIIDYLTAIGHPYKLMNGTAYACASIVRSGADNPRNLSISLHKNLWKDQVTGKGGSIIDLVMLHRQCDYSTAIRWLQEFGGQRGRKENLSFPSRCQIPENAEGEMAILTTHALQHPMWLNFVRSRCVSEDLAMKYLSEVQFAFRRDLNAKFWGVGWQGRNGGWHIRTKMNKLAKLSTSPADITHIVRGSSEVCVFEGIMDYLAFESRWGMSRDVIILNSTSHASKAISLIIEMKYTHAHLYLDNDDAGDHATDLLEIKLPKVNVIDHRNVYKFLCINDVNAYIIYLNHQQSS